MCPDPYCEIGDPLRLQRQDQDRQASPRHAARRPVAADMPDLTGVAIVHNQRYDESVLLGPLANYTTRESTPLDFSMKWTGALPQQAGHYGYIAFGREHDGPPSASARSSPQTRKMAPTCSPYPPQLPRQLRSADPLLEPGRTAPRTAHHEAAPEGYHPPPGTELQDQCWNIRTASTTRSTASTPAPSTTVAYRGPYVHFWPLPRHQRWRSSELTSNQGTPVLDLREPVGLSPLGARPHRPLSSGGAGIGQSGCNTEHPFRQRLPQFSAP